VHVDRADITLGLIITERHIELLQELQHGLPIVVGSLKRGFVSVAIYCKTAGISSIKRDYLRIARICPGLLNQQPFTARCKDKGPEENLLGPISPSSNTRRKVTGPKKPT
jgi:hypothetical protein